MAKRPINNRNKKFNANSAKKPIGGGVKKRFATTKVQDARTKLIQKKRNNVVDARDVLAKMAKTQDARNKLNKLRQSRTGGGAVNANINVKVIGSNILQKTDRNGKISLVTNKAKGAAGMNVAIRKELGLVTQKKPVVKRPVPPRPPQPISIRQAPVSDIDYVTFGALRGLEPSVYKWAKPGSRTTASQLIGSLENRNRLTKAQLFQQWQNFPVNKLRISPSYEDLEMMDDEEMPMMVPMKQTISLQGSSRISNIHSRLDSSPMEPETHGILAPTKTKVVVPAGHRIVVSNLQPTVTQDDVKELFEDIGHLLAARLVRPGVAEVIYKNLKDAQKAVDTYHNRQLDGQPMKCLLVNKRPLNNPTAPPLMKMDTHGILSPIEISSGNSNKLVPDLSTIHKVLFQRK